MIEANKIYNCDCRTLMDEITSLVNWTKNTTT